MTKKLLFIFLITWPASKLQSQVFIKNYTPNTYEASISNWDVIQDNYGIIYFANLEGILTFNSSDWIFNPTSGATLSIAKDAQNRIYYGTNSDFGFVGIDSLGRSKLFSLAKTFIDNQKVGLIWNITPCNDKIYFFSKNAIYEWNGNKINTIAAQNGRFNYKPICFDERIYLSQENVGIVSLSNSETRLLEGTESLSDDNLLSITNNADENKKNFITRTAGLVKYNKGYLSSSKNLTLNSQDRSIFNLANHNNDLVLATLSDGLVISNQALAVRDVINKSHGLQSNAIKDVHIDQSNNIWTAMQEGVAYIEYGSPWRVIIEKENINGVVTSINKWKGKTFLGTTEGFYSISNHTPSLIKPINKRVWSIYTADNNLFASTAESNYFIGGGKVKQASFNKVTHSILDINQNEKIILHQTGVSITDQEFNQIKDLNIGEETWINGQLDTKGNLWATAKFKGIYKITGIKSEEPKIRLFTKKEGLPDVAEIHITTFKDHLLFTTSKGLYEYIETNPDSLKFRPYKGSLQPSGHVRQVEKDTNGNYYFTIKNGRTDELVKYQPQPDGTFKKIYKPFKRLPEMEITAVYPDKDSTLWVAGSEGVYRYDEKIKKDYETPFNTLVSRATTSDSLIFGGFYAESSDGNIVPSLTIKQPDHFKPKLNYVNNNITFEFAATFYETPERNQFSYYLKNNDQGWSKWSAETKKEYTNLPAGKYTFMVRSKNIYDTIGKTATYQFTILPPWYQTTWAKIVFGLLAILFVWFVSLAYTYRVRQHRRKLKLIVADRTFEVISQKKEIESQNKLLKDQFEEISQQKDEIQKKNKELESSQDEIMTINEKLKELNSSLEKKVELRTHKIKATLEKLKKTNSELDTFVYRASHDLKGPISRIHGLTSLGKLESTDETTKKYYNLIEHAALDMQGLLSKLSHAYEIMNKEVRTEKIDIPSLLSEIRSSVKFLDKGSKYSFDIQEQFTLETDRHLLKIVLENLIENALIFRKSDTDDHQIKISCHEGNNNFYFQIADNGIGIAEEHLGSIYEMFFRGSDRSKGSGLGLHIVRMALEKIMGSITVSSTLYEYTEFTVTVPLHVVPKKEESYS